MYNFCRIIRRHKLYRSSLDTCESVNIVVFILFHTILLTLVRRYPLGEQPNKFTSPTVLECLKIFLTIFFFFLIITVISWSTVSYEEFNVRSHSIYYQNVTSESESSFQTFSYTEIQQVVLETCFNWIEELWFKIVPFISLFQTEEFWVSYRPRSTMAVGKHIKDPFFVFLSWN